MKISIRSRHSGLSEPNSVNPYLTGLLSFTLRHHCVAPLRVSKIVTVLFRTTVNKLVLINPGEGQNREVKISAFWHKNHDLTKKHFPDFPAATHRSGHFKSDLIWVPESISLSTALVVKRPSSFLIIGFLIFLVSARLHPA